MLARLTDLPLFVLLMGIGAASMMLPALHAGVIGDQVTMQAFLYSSLILAVLTGLIALATFNYRPRHPGRSHLLAMLGTFALLPLMLAVPMRVAIPDASLLTAYVEMVSAITTTGATFYDTHPDLAPSIHLWRGFVAWLGGFFVLVTAAAILAPMNLGGFDVLAGNEAGRRRGAGRDEGWTVRADQRLVQYSARLLPIYAGFTLFLWILLVIRNRDALDTVILAMSTLSTSGITATPGAIGATGIGIGGEMAVFAFLLLALSRQPISVDRANLGPNHLLKDPELRLGLALVIAVPLLLFVRHFVGAFEVDETDNLLAALKALWGGMFAVLSFLSTTGFESEAWQQARDWSGLSTPGIILLGLALIGGGVATTAGGVKLLRVYALWTHGLREMDRVLLPSSVGGSGALARRMRREGAQMAWIFFMLFAMSVAISVLALAAAGYDLEESITLAISALSTTGPVALVALSEPISYGALTDLAKGILAACMVLGRLEMLVIIALFNPDFWRR